MISLKLYIHISRKKTLVIIHKSFIKWAIKPINQKSGYTTITASTHIQSKASTLSTFHAKSILPTILHSLSIPLPPWQTHTASLYGFLRSLSSPASSSSSSGSASIHLNQPTPSLNSPSPATKTTHPSPLRSPTTTEEEEFTSIMSTLLFTLLKSMLEIPSKTWNNYNNYKRC